MSDGLSPQPRRVLHLIDLSGPGGAQTVLLELARRMDRSRWDVLAAVAGEGWLADELTRAGIRHVVVPVRKTSFDWRSLRDLTRLIRREAIELIHTHLLGPAIYGGLAGRLMGVPVISTFHGQVDVAPDERFLRAKFAIVNRASRIVFVSEALRDHFLRTTPLRPSGATVVHNGIAFDGLVPAERGRIRRELHLGDDIVLVGAIGHIRTPKGYGTLIEAAALLAARSDRYRLVIVGAPDEPELERELLELRARLGLQGTVHFLGFRSDISAILADLDVYVISSTQEGLSIATIQAMNAGLPVVATRCGGPEEIVQHDRSGLLVDVGDARGIADAVERIRRDEGLALRLGTTGMASVRARFDVAGMVEKYDAIYSAAIGSAGRSRRPDRTGGGITREPIDIRTSPP